MIRKRRKYLIIYIFIIALLITYALNKYINLPSTNFYNLNVEELYKKSGMNISSGTTYYISANGKSNEGISIEEPMSLETANKKTFYMGDRILLKSGDVFFGQINFNIEKQKEEELCYIGKYGEGENPTLSAAKIIDNRDAWKKYSDEIYKIDLKDINNFKGLKLTDDDSCNIGFIRNEKNIFGGLKSNILELEKMYDFYCDGESLYIKSEKNPYDELGNLTLATKKTLFRMSSNCEIENITVKDTSGHGFGKKNDPIENVYLHNNIIKNIGGSHQFGTTNKKTTRYGNAIEFWQAASNIIIEKNLISNVYDAGITLQGDNGKWLNAKINNNIIINTAFPFEFWGTGETNGYENINIEENIIINQGNGWSQLYRPNPEISANYVLTYSNSNAKLDIKFYKNKFFNSIRLYTISKDIKTQEKIINEIKSDNNTYYINNEVEIINNIKGDNPKEKLKEIKKENNSKFYEIIEEDINYISNQMILDSYDFDYIAEYYNKFEIIYKNRIMDTSIIDFNTKLYNNYDKLYSNQNVNNTYKDLIRNLNELEKSSTILKEDINKIYDKQFILLNTIIEEYNNNNLSISKDNYKSIITSLLNISDEYRELFKLYITEDDIEQKPLEDTINNIINRYNDNTDIDISTSTELINDIKNIYENNLKNEDVSYNYLNKRRIQNTCTTISKILEHEIKVNADNESKTITTKSNTDENKYTNKNVEITVNLPNDKSYIVDNNNSNIITFTQNETKNIKVNIRGYEYDYSLKVNNIDKKAPTIDNINDTSKEVTPRVTDENLDKVKLKQGNNEIPYKVGSTISTPGIYTLTAIDKAGNTTNKEFTIYKEYINNSNKLKYVLLKSSEVKAGTISNKNYKILNREYKEIDSNSIVGTGYGLKINNVTYTLIIKGDINGDGKCSVSDLVKIRNNLIGTNELNSIETLGADTSEDGQVSIMDLVKMRQMIIGIE